MKLLDRRMSSLVVMSLVMLVSQLPTSAGNNQMVLCAGAGGLMVGVGAGLGRKHPSYSLTIFLS